MRGTWTIAKREIQAFFVSPIAYVMLTVFLLVQGLSLYLFASYFATSQYTPGAVSQTPLTMFFGNSTLYYIVLLVFVPLMTMRLVAEEKRSGTLEALLTVPITEWQLVLGKYFAALVFWVALWLPTVLYVWILSHYGDVDAGVVAASYLGVFGIGAYYLAIGLLMSAVSRSQIVAAALTFLVVMLLFLLGIFEMVNPSSEAAAVLKVVSVWGHMADFSKGIIDSRYLIFQLSVVVVAIFTAVRVLQSRRYG
jgi:ABC-2 type transport system permease protein